MSRDLEEIQRDRNAVQAKIRRLRDEMMDLSRMPEDEITQGHIERSDRLARAMEKLQPDLDAYDLEYRDARLELVRSKASDPRNTENGDGAASTPYRQAYRRYADSTRTRGMPQEISRALKVLDEEGSHLSSASGDQVDQMLRADQTEYFDPGYIAKRIMITETPEYRSAFMRSLHAAQHNAPLLLTGPEADALRALQNLDRENDLISRGANEGTTTAGGFGIPAFVDPSVILTSGAADAPLLRICRIENVTNNLWKGISSAGMSWSYDTEGAEVSDDTPTLAQPTVTVYMPRGFLPYTVEVSMDYPAFAAEFGRLIDQGYNDLLAAKTMTGTGTNEPFGVFVALSNATSVVTPTTDGSFGGADIFRVWNALSERYRSRATWIMSVVCQSTIRQFAATQSSTSAYFSIDLTGGSFKINDRPVVITDYAPTGVGGSLPGTTGLSNILAVGDFGTGWLMANRAGMSVEAVPHLMGANRRPTGERGMFAWARHGFDSINDSAFKLLQNQ